MGIVMADDSFETLLRDLLALNPEQRRLVQRTVRELLGQGGQTQGVPRPVEPQPEASPEGEKVLAAMQRLRRSYPMLPPEKLLGPASEIMMQAMSTPSEEHPALIARLATLFSAHYQRYLDAFEQENPT